MSAADDDEALESAESSSSDSELEDIEASEEDIAALTQLEEELGTNPNLYDKHTEYIAILRRCKLKAKLRGARTAMHDRFPLTQQLWLEWLDDEESSLKSAESPQELEKLYDLAVSDYLSIPIWLRYLALLTEHDLEVRAGSTAGKEKMRMVYERALSAGGLHISEGSKLWAAARKYEAQHLEAEDPTTAAESVLARLFMRQLQVPLEDGQQTLHEWKELCKAPSTSASSNLQESLPEEVRVGYAKAQAAVQSRNAYEASVAPSKAADLDLLAAFAAYIKLEEASGEPRRVQCIYERALARFPVTHVLWLQYGHYLEQHLNVPQLVQQVYARALRNCPWVGVLWARSLRALERSGSPDSQHEALYNNALAAGMEAPEDYLEVSLARLDAIRRQGPEKAGELRAAFQAVTEMMQTYFPDYVDRALRIPSYWATCELEVAEDYETGREVWEATLKSPLGAYAEAVAAYVAFELAAKHVKEARSIFRKFHRRKLHEGGSAALCEAWLRFEREHGTAEDYFQAFVKAEPVLTAAAAAAAEAAQPELAAETQAASKRGPQLTPAEAKRLRQEKDPNFKKAERPARQQQKRKKGLGFDEERGGKRSKPEHKATAEQSGATAAAAPRFQSEGTQDVNMIDAPEAEAAILQPATGAAVTSAGAQAPGGEPSIDQTMLPPPARTAAAEGQALTPEPPAAVSSQPQEISDLQRTAYIRNIAPAASKEELQALLEPCGPIAELYLPEDRSSVPPKHRGFAYVTFSSPDGLRNAVALNGRELHGKHISVVASHRQVHGDQRTAFILNLSPDTTSEALEALFQPCGTIESTRIPLDRSTSRPRGFAYLEFATTEALQRAVDMTGIELDGRNLKISIATQGAGDGGRRAAFRGRGPGRSLSRGRGRARGPPPPGRFGIENGGSGVSHGEARGRARAGRSYLDVAGTEGANFRPRSVGRGDGAPKSNSDFRAFLNKR